MSKSVTIELPNELARQARTVAAQTYRRVEDVLLEWLGREATEAPAELLPDDQVLALAAMQMSDEQQSELADERRAAERARRSARATARGNARYRLTCPAR